MRINHSRKADISMNTIVLAAIAILVLLVLIVIFTSNIRKPANEVDKTNDQRGSLIDDINPRDTCPDSCMSIKACSEAKDKKQTSLYKCSDSNNDPNQVCCI